MSAMRTQMIVGVFLVLIGVAILVFGGFTYTTTRKAVQVGPVGIVAEEKKKFSIPPVIGGVLVAGGIILLIAGGRTRS
jgi:hypothetical protein